MTHILFACFFTYKQLLHFWIAYCLVGLVLFLHAASFSLYLGIRHWWKPQGGWGRRGHGLTDGVSVNLWIPPQVHHIISWFKQTTDLVLRKWAHVKTLTTMGEQPILSAVIYKSLITLNLIKHAQIHSFTKHSVWSYGKISCIDTNYGFLFIFKITDCRFILGDMFLLFLCISYK